MGRILLSLAMLALCVTHAHAVGPSIGEHLSPGGTRFVLAVVPKAHDVAIRVAWHTDWAMDDDMNHAVPILATTSQFNSGADGFDPGALNVLFDDADADARLTIDSQFVYGSIVSPRHDAEYVLAAINAHLRAPSFEETSFRRFRDSFRDFVAEIRHKPSTLAFDAIYWTAFGDHPIRTSSVFRDLHAASAVERSDLASWAEATYTSVPLELVIAGDIDARTAGRLVDLLLLGLPDDPLPSAALPVAVPRAGKVLIHAPHAKETYLAVIGAVAVSTDWPKDRDGFIQWTLSHSGKGILNEAVRGSARAAYFIDAEVGEFHYDSHFLLMHGSVDTSKANASLEELLDVYDSYVKSPSLDGLEQFRSEAREINQRISSDPIDLSVAALRATLRGHDVSLTLELLASAGNLFPDSIHERVRNGFPEASDLLVVVASPDVDALPGACVIKVPREVLECDLK